MFKLDDLISLMDYVRKLEHDKDALAEKLQTAREVGVELLNTVDKEVNDPDQPIDDYIAGSADAFLRLVGATQSVTANGDMVDQILNLLDKSAINKYKQP